MDRLFGNFQMPQSRLNCCLVPLLLVTIFGAASVGRSLAEDASPKFVGGSSCATAMCHGGGIGQKFVGAEHIYWSAKDRHATKAYQVLFNDVSVQMVKQLGYPKPAHESAVCLNCHSPATGAPEKSLPGRAPLNGVGCEQCHGAAEHWLKPHVIPNWKKTATEKDLKGFRDLTDVLTRANVCADCHVGEPGREVNHDLIAAGHPRLFFELTTFHANYPRHWPDETDAKRHPVNPDAKELPGSLLEARLWAVGQVVTAQRSLKLLSHRAAAAKDTPAKWPELAEYNCFSCHHDLRSNMPLLDSEGKPVLDSEGHKTTVSWRQARDASKRPRVSFELNAWPYAMLGPLARQTNGPDLSGLNSPFANLRIHFLTLASPADAISREANDAAKMLQVWAKELNQGVLTPAMIEKMRQTLLAEDGQKLVSSDWDSATQVFLSLNALQYASIAARRATAPADLERDRQIQLHLDSISEALNFLPGLRSPNEFVPHPNDPQDRMQSDLRSLQKLLSTP